MKVYLATCLVRSALKTHPAALCITAKNEDGARRQALASLTKTHAHRDGWSYSDFAFFELDRRFLKSASAAYAKMTEGKS